jgi:hypothetical protein
MLAEFGVSSRLRAILVTDQLRPSAAPEDGTQVLVVRGNRYLGSLDDQTTEYTNHIHASATDEFIAFIKERGESTVVGNRALFEELESLCMNSYAWRYQIPELVKKSSRVPSQQEDFDVHVA